jgi:transposase-like protein
MKTGKKRERDQRDELLDRINFKGLAQEEVPVGAVFPSSLPGGCSKKRWKRMPLFNDQIIPMYSFVMTNRDIKSHLEQAYNGEVPPELANRVTDAVMEDAGEWQSRALGKSCAIVCLDALRVNSRDRTGKAAQRACMWLLETEGTKFWAPVLNGIRNRGTEDILTAHMDGLAGFPGAVRAVFPRTRIQRRIVHMVRSSARFVS